MPEDERVRVFEAFYRPAGRAESAGGWGLGLALVRQIAERHGGTGLLRGGTRQRRPFRGRSAGIADDALARKTAS